MYEQHTDQNRTTASARIKTTYRTLVYQWAIHLASALEAIHSYAFEAPAPKIAISFGDLNIDSCWLSSKESGLSLSLMGFVRSSFRTRSSPEYVGDIVPGSSFEPLAGVSHSARKPTPQTDIFLWGCVVYELMTGSWPGDGQGLSHQDIQTLVSRQEWPRLETEYLGDIVRKCWSREITSAAELLATVRQSVQEFGVVVGESDQVVELDVVNLTI